MPPMYTVRLTHLEHDDDWRPVLPVAESPSLGLMMQLAGLLAQHAHPFLQSVAILDQDEATIFSWTPEGAAKVR